MLNDRYVFSQLIDSLPKHEFDRCVARYHGNRRIRNFSCFDQGSSCVSGTWSHQECDQGSQQRLATFPSVMNELEETQVERQLLL
jgi:hypothetical protein